MGNVGSISLHFSAIFSFTSNVFIKLHEYSNYISFDNYHKIKGICLSIAVISSLVL